MGEPLRQERDLVVQVNHVVVGVTIDVELQFIFIFLGNLVRVVVVFFFVSEKLTSLIVR